MDNDISETVYGTHEDSHATMSERVQTLAASIYKEFERMIKNYDENVVKELMPLVVGILESLDQSYLDKQENEVELELLRDDNEQLLTQYEREKQLRKAAEQKFLEIEDTNEEERKELQSKVESLESNVRMFELKAKNAQDHISRLDEKEQDMRKEYNKLHERYTELFKTHMDYMERTKILMGADAAQRIMDTATTPRGKGGFTLPLLRQVTPVGPFPSGETPTKSTSSPGYSATSPARPPHDSNLSLRSELKEMETSSKNQKEEKNKFVETAEKGAETEMVELRERSTGTKKEVESDSAVLARLTAHSDDIGASIVKPQVKSEGTTEDTSTVPPANPAQSLDTIDSKLAPSSHGSQGGLTPPLASVDSFTEPQFETFGDGDMLPPSADALAPTPDIEAMDQSGFERGPQTGPVNMRKQNESSLYDELTFQDSEVINEVDDGVDITGNVVTPGEYSSSVGDNFFGMGREVENLILENTELLATKNALNVVKDDLIAKVDELSRVGSNDDIDLSDEYIPIVLRSEQEILREEIASLQAVKTRLKVRVQELEDELKKTKADLEKAKQQSSGTGEDEDDVPMAQRKRFTRVEMARVLMERNQYKERLMELQEAVRWTEMIRASREHPELVPSSKKKSTIWNFFSNLFSSSNKPAKKLTPSATVRYNAPTTQVRPVGDPNKTQRDNYNLGEKAKAYDFLQDDLLAEKKRKERERERREQYKAVQVHVKKDDGRMQAYGWSLPAKFNPPTPKDQPQSRNHVPVPVPVYCRPLLERESGIKIWCAAGVNLSGGKTRDGGSVVGASVFYSPPADDSKLNEDKDDVEKLNHELKEHEKSIQQRERLSSLVWICTTATQSSRVTIIDANSPADVLETFHITVSPILCIASVPGASEEDYAVDNESLKADLEVDASKSPKPSPTHSTESSGGGTDTTQDSGIGSITFVQCATGTTSTNGSKEGTPVGTPPAGKSEISEAVKMNMTSISHTVQGLSDAVDPVVEDETIHAKVIKATGSPVVCDASSDEKKDPAPGEKRLIKLQPSELITDGLNSVPTDHDVLYDEVEKMESLLPTMWLGSQSGSLYVHSAVSQWRRCLHSVKLKDSVLSIVHVKGRVFVALADGTVAVFHRGTGGQWDLTNYHLVDLGRPHHSIRCMCVIANKYVWCGYRNKVHVLHPKTLRVEKSFDAHPRKESQVRQLAWVGDGVWVSIRLDSTLRLYHAYTYQHLQDVDIEPYVSKMLGTGKLGFSFVRITSLLISSSRLWIGTGNGVIISVPLSESNKQSVMTSTGPRPGGVIRVYNDAKTDTVTPGSFIPYCSMAQAQLSFHGHRDAVKFFAAVPGAPARGLSAAAAPPGVEKEDDKHTKSANQNMLVISGGEGYIDFRIGDPDDEEKGEQEVEEEEEDETDDKNFTKGDRSHLIVWQVFNRS